MRLLALQSPQANIFTSRETLHSKTGHAPTVNSKKPEATSQQNPSSQVLAGFRLRMFPVWFGSCKEDYAFS
jgi:hypothetical protein